MRRRGYIIIHLYCAECGSCKPFNHIKCRPSPQKKVVRRINGGFVVQPSPNPTPNIPENARLVRGSCMICGHTAQFVTTEAHWKESQYSVDALCSCGLPMDHEGKHLREVHRGAAA